MVQIDSFRVEDREKGLVTDKRHPRFSFAFSSDRENVFLRKAEIRLAGESFDATSQVFVPYPGKALKAHTDYVASLFIETEDGDKAEKEVLFRTGKLDLPWKGRWITDGEYVFKEKAISPKVMTFCKIFRAGKTARKAEIFSTALGIYDLLLNGKRVFDRYLAPGYTSYPSHLQYQVSDITALLKEENELLVPVSGGWAVGSFVMSRKNRIYAKRQALLLEIRIEYEDGSLETIVSDESFDVTMDGPYRKADIYDGEDYDARKDYSKVAFHKASFETVKLHPSIEAEYGLPVVGHERLDPVSVKAMEDGALVYDFGQNFAGIVHLHILNAKEGQEIDVRHAEILREDGHINVALLRSAKQQIRYFCKAGEQDYHPTLTYMGFRYVEIRGIAKEDVDVYARALYSDMPLTGSFSCSDERINRLHENIVWSSRSNFVDIPTDCPQRDERMGWTGDIALFSPVATYLFQMNGLLEKWLLDLKSEQRKTGAIPTTVPHKGYGFPETFPTVACDFWGDAALLVPLAMYNSYGNRKIVEDLYPTMKGYVDACLFWARLFSFGKKRYIWKSLDFIHFGDWVAPGQSMAECQSRHPWTATASLFNTSRLLSRFATLLGKKEDAKKYDAISKKVADAYQSVFFDDNGRLRKKEFQTGYVLPLYFGMLTPDMRKKASDRLAKLVKENGYRIATGFPGTPYILFALCDNGHKEEAIKMLLNEKNPSWLHEVVTGGTTIWERFDGLDDGGKLNVPEDGTGGMISFNHYASGAVGDFFYRRLLGIEPKEPGYKAFTVEPVFFDEIPSCKGSVLTPYGRIAVSYDRKEGHIEVLVPANTRCTLLLDGERKELTSGRHRFELTR
ncbi:MAG TPA: family 78 glycoside hydrolase catalytic domain [Candidatus Enterosoma merdigallinarum]|nr:family 78 glycoside hydrolase catalytic domain [Candidatus Enterosoma merdigallinarum]